MGKSAPAPQDYKAAAEATAQSGQQAVNSQTQANRPNVNTAFGQQSWTKDANGNWTMSAGLSPELQGIFGDVKGFDFGSLGQMTDGSAARDQAIQAAYGQATSRLNPMWDQRENQMRQQLANQGLDPNSEAGRNAMQQLNMARNDAYSSAMNSAIMHGQQAGDSLFRNNMTARQQAIVEALRGPQIGALGQMMGFMQTPNYNQAGAWGPTNYMGAAMAGDQYNMQNTQQQNQSWADAIKGLFSLGGAIGG